jgi:hypothetical protein
MVQFKNISNQFRKMPSSWRATEMEGGGRSVFRAVKICNTIIWLHGKNWFLIVCIMFQIEQFAMENGPFIHDTWWFTHSNWWFSIAMEMNNLLIASPRSANKVPFDCPITPQFRSSVPVSPIPLVNQRFSPTPQKLMVDPHFSWKSLPKPSFHKARSYSWYPIRMYIHILFICIYPLDVQFWIMSWDQKGLKNPKKTSFLEPSCGFHRFRRKWPLPVTYGAPGQLRSPFAGRS